MKMAALLAVFVMSIGISRADVRLPAILSDHMVLQAGTTVPVWGWADPDEGVSVSIAGQTKTTRADAVGKWVVKLDQLRPDVQPQVLTVKGKNTLAVKDVLAGEVWLGSGQSNMAMVMVGVRNAAEEMAAANYPALRMFKITSSGNFSGPQEDCKGEWQVCSPRTIKLFSATAYFFGRELHKTLGVPVGLINASVGGTPIESWVSLEAQLKTPELKASAEAQLQAQREFDAKAATADYEVNLGQWKLTADAAKAAGQEPPPAPRDPVAERLKVGEGGGLFNGKIAPLIPYAIRGTIWYQGEANSRGDKAALYRYQLPALIMDWRARWGYDFPFIAVQLPNFGHGANWPLLREAVLQSLKLKNTGIAIGIDIGETDNIHPKNKQEIGRRLALSALGDVYGQKVASTCGPLPAGQQIQGQEIAVSFTHADGGLVARDGELKEFLIAGSERKWVTATARINGDKVLVSSPQILNPVAVRYAWSMNPQATLYNGAGLPASPFRTDDWK